jgi:hypothetical protein
MLWLRNGGGKTSLLSLFFASIRPSKHDFLGKRAEGKIRRIEDYVGTRDRSVVVCEWELDDGPKLFDDDAPRYLSGFFHQRKSGSDDDGSPIGLETAFFATKVSDVESQLTLEGLPLLVSGESAESENGAVSRKRISLAGFRRKWRQLRDEHSDHDIFIHEQQNKFAQELADRGIDPELFFYQITMNEREGGVSARFAFSEPEEFVDFLLDMAFDRARAKQVKEQLTTFRHELMERNEQLKPEKELCQALLQHLQKMMRIRDQRMETARNAVKAKNRLEGLQAWIADQMATNDLSLSSTRSKLVSTRTELENAGAESDRLLRHAAVLNDFARSRIADQYQTDYDEQHARMRTAERLKNIWEAAVPLAQVQKFVAEAKQHREDLARKQQQLEPDRKQLLTAGTAYANAIDFRLDELRSQRTSHLAESDQQKKLSDKRQLESSQLGEAATKAETVATQIQEKLDEAGNAFKRLQQELIVLESETAEAAQTRIKAGLEELAQQADESQKLIDESTDERDQIAARNQEREQERNRLDKELAVASNEYRQAVKSRQELEADETLLRLLQTTTVNADVSATKAISKADEERPKVHQAMLELEVESVEDRRSLFSLDDHQLLPPGRDVNTLMQFLKRSKITCYSGWQYFASTLPIATVREKISQLPHIASGIVVANKDFDAVMELCQNSENVPRLTSPVVVSPASALDDDKFGTWQVFGPESDAHFDTAAAPDELERLNRIVCTRQDEIAENKKWYDELTSLADRLRQFRTQYPRGWFTEAEQKVANFESQVTDLVADIEKDTSAIAELENRIANEVEQQSQTAKATRASEVQLGKCENYIEDFNGKIPEWNQQLKNQKQMAEESRTAQQQKLTEANDLRNQSDKSKDLANSLSIQISDQEKELAKIAYVIDSERKPVAADIERLQSEFEQRRKVYEGQLNKDGLKALAERADEEAKLAQSDLQRIIGKNRGFGQVEVEEQLKTLPAGISVALQKDNADSEYDASSRKLGPMKTQLRAAMDRAKEAKEELKQLGETGALPDLEPKGSNDQIIAESDELRKQSDNQSHWQAALEDDVKSIESEITDLMHKATSLEKDQQRMQSIAGGQASFFARLAILAAPAKDETLKKASCPTINKEGDIDRIAGEVESQLQQNRERFDGLDVKRTESAKRIHDLASQRRYEGMTDSISLKFKSRDAIALERNASSDIEQVNDRIFQIDRQLETADKQLEIVVEVILSAANDGLNLMNRVSRLSRLPDSLPQAGKQFINIVPSASDDHSERRTKIRDLVGELLEQGDIGEGLSLIKKAVRRIASPIKVRVLHPDLHQNRSRFNIHELGLFSGGEKLTVAILLYCSLVRLRQREGHGKSASSVLVLDNPIGTASRISFLDMQREVAEAMNVQLIYATAVKDLDAVGCLENIIRLKNSRADRRTGKRMVEVDAEETEAIKRKIEAARVSFKSAPASLVDNNSANEDDMDDSEHEVYEDVQEIEVNE